MVLIVYIHTSMLVFCSLLTRKHRIWISTPFPAWTPASPGWTGLVRGYP